MLTPKGPKVIESTTAVSATETQVVLPLLESDLLDIMWLSQTVRWTGPTSASKTAPPAASFSPPGYPGKSQKGFEITLPETGQGEAIFIAGAKLETAF
jgi:phosphoribosylamine--glycine ligase